MAMDLFQKTAHQYICDANLATHFKLVKDEKDLERKEHAFHPAMSHQIFGETEQIFGYSKLHISINYSASSLQPYVSVDWQEKINPSDYEGVKPDNILDKLKEVLPPKFDTNLDQFSLELQKQEDFVPYGDMFYSYKRRCKITSAMKTYEIYKANMKCPGFREYHRKMESFILWFVDAASFIDADDDKWDYYVMFEKVKECGKTSYTFVGYSTCYRFYAYPDKMRPRISQVLILPPFQRRGHCAELIRALYGEYVPRKDVVDITAEDPSEDFQRVRDFVDATNCARLVEFSPHNLKLDFNKPMAQAAVDNFKINKRQARRIYEILRLKSVNASDEHEMNEYRSCVKNRINAPLQSILSRKKCLALYAQMSSSLPGGEEQQRDACVQREFERLVDEYRKVISRLAV